MHPNIAVLIPHFNNIAGLYKSIQSISCSDIIDIIIVDDGSNSKPDINDIRYRFPKLNNIELVKLPENMGIDHALNLGLHVIVNNKQYKYIARLDCGDTTTPERFKIQSDFLDKNQNVYLVGSWVSFVSMTGEHLFTSKFPVDHKTIKKKMYINNMFIHPAVMFKASAVDKIGYYPTDYKYAEDYAFFFKFVRNFETANINKILVTCEFNPDGISLTKRSYQLKSKIRILSNNFIFGIYPTYGLFRNLLLYCIPYSLIIILKRRYHK